MGFSILKSAAAVLTDAAWINPDQIKEVVNNIKEVKDCHEIRSRGDENYINIDLHVLIDPETRIVRAHEVAHTVEKAIKKEFPTIKDVVIHIEPYHEKKA